jgi:hypothetical protein
VGRFSPSSRGSPIPDMVQPKLIIHLDVNGTIMPADPIKSKHVKSMLNIHLSKQAFVRRVEEEESNQFVWWDGSPFQKGVQPPLLPQYRYTCHIREHYKDEGHVHQYPVDDSISLEDFNSVHNIKCDNFTSQSLPGSVYKSELLNLMDTLEWKHEGIEPCIVETLTLPVTEGRRMNIFVPAFLELLRHLNAEGQEFILVIRTFGSDVPRLMPAFELISQGLHPDLPVPNCVSSPSIIGSLERSPNSDGDPFVLEYKSKDENESIVSIKGSDSIVSFLEGLPSKSVVMINDDYDTWRDNMFSPMFGKPVWLDMDRISSVRHLLFDDNVNIDPTDSIACVWLKDEANRVWKPLPLDTQAGKATIGTVLLQASLYFAILKKDSFVSELTKANKRYESLRYRLGLSHR